MGTYRGMGTKWGDYGILDTSPCSKIDLSNSRTRMARSYGVPIIG